LVAEKVPVQQLVSFLKERGQYGATPLHMAATSEQGGTFLKVVAEKVLEQLGEFLRVQDEMGDTPLHRAAQYKKGGAFLKVLSEVLPGQWIDLLKTPNLYSHIPIQEAALSPYGAQFLEPVAEKLSASVLSLNSKSIYETVAISNHTRSDSRRSMHDYERLLKPQIHLQKSDNTAL
jgi:ankyrin repeat protein